MKQYLLPLLLLIAFNCRGQNTITGRIISKADNTPVANATVFLNNSAFKTATNSNGKFTLRNVTTGEYQLLVNVIGYENYRIPVAVTGNLTIPDIAIVTKTEVLNDVTIKAKPKLSPCYYVFVTNFFGSTQFARQCKILNPYAIQFYDIDQQGGFSARSDKFIEIENGALGYKIRFLLVYFIKNGQNNSVSFNGESYFEEMQGTPAQKAQWQINRLECYQGSMMQLLRAVMTDSVKENGFHIKRAHRQDNPFYNRNGLQVDPYDLDNAIDFDGNSDNTKFDDKISNGSLQGKQILLTTNQPGLFAIAGDVKDNNSLFIEHLGNSVPTLSGKSVRVPWIWRSTNTFVTFTKPYLIFDNTGKLLNPRSANSTGFFTEQTRMATQLPYDYKPM